jgi:hypothetical protein
MYLEMEWNEPHDGRFDRIIKARRCEDEPEEDVDHVNNLDVAVEAESITEHEFPWRERFRLEGLKGPVHDE